LYFDIETTGFDPYTEKMVSLQFWDGEGDVLVLDARRKDPRRLGRVLGPVFYGARIIIGHNLKFDLSWMLAQCGINPRRIRAVWDTMIAEQYLKGLGMSDGMKQGVSFTLKATAQRRGLGMSKEERNWFIGLNSRVEEWGAPFPPEQISYMEQDVRVLAPIFKDQRREINERGMANALRDEGSALLALVEAETTGISIDVEGWRDFIKEKESEAAALYEEVSGVFSPPVLADRARRFEEEMQEFRSWEASRDAELECLWKVWGEGVGQHTRVGWGDYKVSSMSAWRASHPRPKKPKVSNDPVNLQSPPQLLCALRALGIEVDSSGVEILEPLKDQYPEVDLLLKWRKAVKFSQSFGESLLEKINPVTGRLHPTFHQVGASSGRMSSSNPNFQQVPSRGDGARLRACVVAPPGKKLIVADYSAQELRILADLSGDENLLRFFEEEANLRDDIHQFTARLMFGVPEEQDIPKDLRSAAKTINYGVVYGIGAPGLSRQLKSTVDRAQELMGIWFEAYPGIKPWLDEQASYTQKHHESPTATGWIRRLQNPPAEPTRPRRYSDGGYGEGAWEEYHTRLREYKASLGRLARQGMNTPIQGTAAGITKKALAYFMKGCYNTVERSKRDQMKIIAVVHDEIVLEADEEAAEEAAEYLADCMDAACKLVLKRVHIPHTQAVISDHWTH
jgi:DNA polymerase I-like protein with 3'-5' exonuclease and polymerase domains